MVILHIASCKNSLCSGVDVTVPQHILAQGKWASVGVINSTNLPMTGIENLFHRHKNRRIQDLPAPFCKPDLIVFHEVYKPAYLGIYKQAMGAGIPYVIVPHGCLTKIAQRKKRLKKAVGNFLFFHSFIRNASALQYVSVAEQQNTAFRQASFVATNGIAIPQAHKTSWSEKAIRMVYIGRTEIHIKGLDILLEAVESIADELRAEYATLSLYGPDEAGSLRILRRRIQDRDLEDLVHLHGPIHGKEKETVLLHADLFLQASRSEGMPMGVLEALSYGLPCLVTEGTNLGKTVRQYDAGWVTETSASSIAAGLQQAICERHLWAKKSKNARTLIEENFLWDTVAKKAIREYKKIIGSEEM